MERQKVLPKYKLQLREDMPPGFIQNDKIPELPTIHRYLAGLIETPRTKLEWQRVFDQTYRDYMQEEGFDPNESALKPRCAIPTRRFPEISARQGINIGKKLEVYVHNDGLSGQCWFGNLVRVSV